MGGWLAVSDSIDSSARRRIDLPVFVGGASCGWCVFPTIDAMLMELIMPPRTRALTLRWLIDPTAT